MVEEDIQRYKEQSLAICQKLLQKLNENDDDANRFFGGEINQAYRNVTDMAKSKVINIQTKIKNL